MRRFPSEFAVSSLFLTAAGALAPFPAAAFSPAASWRASAPVKAVAFSSDGRKAYFAAGNSVGVWEPDAGRAPALWKGHADQVLALALSPDGRRLLSAGLDQSLMLWDAESGREVATWTGHEDAVTAAAFSPDGARALSGDDGGALLLWNAATGTEEGTWNAPGGRICTVAFLRDGRAAVSGGIDENLRLWRLPEGGLLRSWRAHRNHSCSVMVSKDGRTALSGGGDGLLKLWDASTWKELASLGPPAGPVRSLALAPDGTQALCGRAESLLELWELPGGRKAASWRAHQGAVHAVAFSPDGRRALSGGEDGALNLWNLAAAPSQTSIPEGAPADLERAARESDRSGRRFEFAEKIRSARQEAAKFHAEEERSRLKTAAALGFAALGGVLGIGFFLARRRSPSGEAGQGHEAAAPFKPLNDQALLWAAAEEADCESAARHYHAAGMGPNFLIQAQGKPGAYCAAYARAFLKLGDARTALSLLQMRENLEPEDFPVLVESYRSLGLLNQLDAGQFPPNRRIFLAEALAESGLDALAMEALLQDDSPHLALGEFIVAMRVCLRLGNANLAQELLAKASGGRGPAEAPDCHFYFAHFCERLGRIDRARELYEVLLRSPGRSREARERLRNLAAISPEDARRIQALGEKRGPDTRRSLAPAGAPAAPGAWPPTEAEIVGGKFELQEVLGIGGMGVVYKGWDRALSRTVAVKKMHEAQLGDAASRARFVEEALVVAKLSHPYIVSIFDIARVGEVVYLVFEYVDGQSLAELIAARGRLPPKECVRLLRFTCEALAYAHDNKVIHRDLKPANAMLDRRGYLKIMDFGLARRLGDSSPAAAATREVAGTPAYMAPEQHEGRSSALSDVFSLGAMAYEMVSGELPFPGPDFLAQKLRHLGKPLPEDIPSGISRLIAACLQGEPADRPQGIRPVLEALKDL